MVAEVERRAGCPLLFQQSRPTLPRSFRFET